MARLRSGRRNERKKRLYIKIPLFMTLLRERPFMLEDCLALHYIPDLQTLPYRYGNKLHSLIGNYERVICYRGLGIDSRRLTTLIGYDLDRS